MIIPRVSYHLLSLVINSYKRCGTRASSSLLILVFTRTVRVARTEPCCEKKLRSWKRESERASEREGQREKERGKERKGEEQRES